jgi:ABC-type polar amino acid transport system ATPase subunit
LEPVNVKTEKEWVRLDNVVKKFKEATVLKGVSFSVQKGDKIVIIGPSGGGKSTLLRCINGLEPVTSGRIIVAGEEITALSPSQLTKARQRIGMVFQQFNLFPHLTAMNNITLSLRQVLKKSREESETIAKELLARVGLADKGNAYPDELSGGQQQRVAIARTLAMNPAVILFDEPTSALDPEMVSEVIALIEDLARQEMTMIISSHEMAFVKHIASRIIFLDQGKVAEEGSPHDLFNRPDSQRLQQFLSKVHPLD